MRFKLSHYAVLSVALLTVAPAAIAQRHDTEFTLFGAYRFGGTIDVMDSNSLYEAQDSPKPARFYPKAAAQYRNI